MRPMEPQTPTSSEAPSTPRHSLGTEHDTESEDRDNDNVFVDNSNDIWEFREHHTRRTESGLNLSKSSLQSGAQTGKNHMRHKSSPDLADKNKGSRVATYRAPIQSDV